MSDESLGDPRQRTTMPDYEMPLRSNSGQVEVTVPSDLVRFHEFEGGEPISFVPRLSQGTIVFDLLKGRGGWSNERNIKQVGKYDQTILRFPKEFAVECGLFSRVDCEEGVRVTFETHFQRDLTLSTQPPMKPFEFPDQGKELATPYYTHLDKNPNENSHQLRLSVRQSWSDESVLDLSGGEKYATRLSSRNEELALSLDLNVDPKEYGRSNVRSFFEHELGSPESTRDYTEVRGPFSKSFAHGLDLARPTKQKITLKIWPEPNRIMIQRLRPRRMYY